MSARSLRPTYEGDGRAACDGILGASFLHAYGAVIDYPAGLLHFRDPLVAEHTLQGRWRCVAREQDGAAVPMEKEVQVRLQIRGEVATFEVSGKGFRYRIGLDPSTTPKRMDLVDADDYPLPMIYNVVDDRLTVAAALFEPRTRVGSRPTEFRSTKNGAVSVLTFEKEP